MYCFPKLAVSPLTTAAFLIFQFVGLLKGECYPADVALVLDDSESIRIFNRATDSFTFAANYSSIVRDILSGLDPSTVRVSLVTYSQTAVALVRFTSDYKRIVEEVDTYTREYETQRTDLGLGATIKEFQKRTRPDVYKYMVVFMDGTSFSPSSTKAQVIEADRNNITILSVSMRGPLQENLVLAGRSYRSFHVATPKELAPRKDMWESIASIICSECKGYSEVVYLLDGSDSTRRLSADFTRTVYAPGVIDFVVNATLKLSSPLVRKGIIVYSQEPTVVSNITNDKTVLIESVRAMQPQYLNTEAGAAFRAATQLFEDASPPAPYDTQRVVVYFVDGSVTNKTDLMLETSRTRSKGIGIFAVGFSNAALTSDLLQAADSPADMARLSSDRELDGFVDLFVDFLCQTPSSLTVEETTSS